MKVSFCEALAFFSGFEFINVPFSGLPNPDIQWMIQLPGT
jgi:hypothetical protein